jgi:hypothetical protein
MNKKKWVTGYIDGLVNNRIFDISKTKRNILLTLQDDIDFKDVSLYHGYISARLAVFAENYKELDLTIKNML